MTDLALKAADEMTSIAKLSFELDPRTVVDLVALIQDGLRNPIPDRPLVVCAVGRAFVDTVRTMFAGYPAVVALIDRGME